MGGTVKYTSIQEALISVLYLLCFLYFITEWYYLDWVVVINGHTRESIFWVTVGNGLQWVFVLNDFLQNSLLIISDGLLIWRCYHVWGQSFRVISAPLILLVAECGLFVATTVLNMKFNQITSDENVKLFNNISSALTFVSLGTTVITTFLIGYRIYSASRSNRSPSKRLFNHIVVMIIESAAAYSLALLFDAIVFVFLSNDMVGSTLDVAEHYVQTVVIVVAKKGVSPTILVARIALTDTNSTDASATLTHISGELQFGSQQGSGRRHSQNTTEGEVNGCVQADDAEPTPVIEVKRESNMDGMFRVEQV
ncbi:hypothetical protein CVT25_003590 [Psilocybe cyanescens]|uniref:Uncharacterized protein n=1 Tax=Psilocybe cyanescens TaxID=93625 RepID=A0A409W6K3_PSICY|nr:hypothetical protein CVT25_003590 [Psilocybe cyanescens]